MPLPVLQDSDLLSVNKPAQYLGGERGSVDKSDEDIDLHVCLAFPDTYEVGMSHVGMQILYDLINRDQHIWAERAYVPMPDMEALLRKKEEPLRALESQRPLAEFDVVGFSLQYELCMNGILTMLDLAGLPLKAEEREDQHPIIIGGGPVCYHPEPFADFFDAFLIGDGEELVPEFLQELRRLKRAGGSRSSLIEELCHIPGVYVPAFFQPEYSELGAFIGMRPLREGYSQIDRRVIATLEDAPYPENPIVPNIQAVHDRLSIEVMRGCVRGCRFCQAGYLYRPQRERSPEELLKIVKKSLKNTGYEELSLLSLSTADYCSILPLLSELKQRFAAEDQLAISFPSTRVDSLKPELLQEVQPVRRSGFTIAPEAGTQRMRDVINKGVSEEQLMDTCRNVFKLGWNSLKMYFMIGLPTETDEDVAGIVDLAAKVKEIAGKGRDITVSVSTHVPKPHTPFQWSEQISEGETIRKQQFLLRELKKLRVNFRYHNAFSSFLEGVFARGDRQLGRLILRAYELGCRLDGWVEELSSDLWQQAFSECGIDPQHYLHERSVEANLPWDHISCDIPKRYFLKEWQRALANRITPDCLTKTCSICGACDYDAARNVLFDRSRSEQRLNIVSPPWLKIIEKRASGQETDLLDAVDQIAEVDLATSRKKESNGGYTLREYLQTEADQGASQATASLDQAVQQRLRLRYSKCGRARFHGHLELANIFFRSARRAGLPIAFSKGFNPKPRFSFGPPLQLGLSSTFEFVDIFLTAKSDPAALMAGLNAELPEGMQVLAIAEVSLKTQSIQASIQTQRFQAQIDPDLDKVARETEQIFKTDHWQELTVDRVRKRKRRQQRLGESIDTLEIGSKQLSWNIRYGENAAGLKPYEVLGALTDLDVGLFDVWKVGVEMRGVSPRNPHKTPFA